VDEVGLSMRWRIRPLCLWRGVDWRRSSLAWLGYGPWVVDIVLLGEAEVVCGL
jgi:hypothetical protein